MSVLIDDLVKTSSVKQEIKENYWYIAKPYGFYGWRGLVTRVKDAWRVLTGKSRAFHYKEDENDCNY